jgi:hypothetical protein
MNAGPALSIGQRQALEEYTSAAGALWDIVDVAGLPEDDRHLAMQRLLLRQPFVPLRLIVEAPAEEGWSDAAVQQLESRWQSKRLSDPGRGIRDGRDSPKE